MGNKKPLPALQFFIKKRWATKTRYPPYKIYQEYKANLVRKNHVFGQEYKANLVRKNGVISQEYKANLVREGGIIRVLRSLCTKKQRGDCKCDIVKLIIEGSLAGVEEILTDFHLSDLIGFDNNRFFLSTEVKDKVPTLVANSVIKPILAKNGLSSSEIEEWAIHQGGSEVLKRFLDESVLGLTPQQLSRSQQLFEKYGNFSSPSCFFVLDSFMQENSVDKTGIRGMMVGFGAGLYQAALLYRWV